MKSLNKVEMESDPISGNSLEVLLTVSDVIFLFTIYPLFIGVVKPPILVCLFIAAIWFIGGELVSKLLPCTQVMLYLVTILSIIGFSL